MAHVLVSPLNWGLGHATRDIPVIRTLRDHGHEVTIAACGNALSVLRQEFPDAPFIEYRITRSRSVPGTCLSRNSLHPCPSCSRQSPASTRPLIRSSRKIITTSSSATTGWVSSRHVSPQSLFPTSSTTTCRSCTWPAELLAIPANRYLHEQYRPHHRPRQFSGAPFPCRKTLPSPDRRGTGSGFFLGILSGTRQMACSQDLDYLIIISGPEPQRSILEKIILARIGELDGSGVVLLGSPQGSKTPARRGDWICIPYVPTEIKAELMNRAKCVICRSGYTTLMELAELGKTQALLIPTPGQTEQEYLSWYTGRKAGSIQKTRTSWISQKMWPGQRNTPGSRRCPGPRIIQSGSMTSCWRDISNEVHPWMNCLFPASSP